MRKPWVAIVVVLFAGLAVGAAIAGRPTTPAHDIRITDVTTIGGAPTTTPAPSFTAAGTVAVGPTTPGSATETVSTARAVTTASSDPPPTSAAFGKGNTPTTAAVSPANTTVLASGSSTTTSNATTVPVAQSTPGGTAVDRRNVRVLVVNSGKGVGIAGAEAARLATIGYSHPSIADGTKPLDHSTVYARAGHEAEAQQLLTDAGLSTSRVLAYPSKALTTVDSVADVFLVLGLDWAG
jgi:hypothetical protein